MFRQVRFMTVSVLQFITVYYHYVFKFDKTEVICKVIEGCHTVLPCSIVH